MSQEAEKEEKSTGEASAFIENGNVVKVEVVNAKTDKSEGDKKGDKKCLNRKCLKISLLTIGGLVVLVLLIGLVRYLVFRSKLTGRANLESAEAWKKSFVESGPAKEIRGV